MKLLPILVSENKLLEVLQGLSLQEIKDIVDEADNDVEIADRVTQLIFKKARELCEATSSSIDLETFTNFQNLAIIAIIKGSLLAEIAKSDKPHSLVQSINMILGNEKRIISELPSGDSASGKEDLDEDMTRLGLKDVEEDDDKSK